MITTDDNEIRDHFKENGFAIIPNAIDPDFIEELNLICVKNTDYLVSKSGEGDVFMCEKGPKQIQNLHTLNLSTFKTFTRTILQDYIFSSVFFFPSVINILNIQLFVKYPGYKITSPHQDGAYFKNPGEKIITLWIPLQDVSVENSCLWYTPGSHKNGLIEHQDCGSNVRNRTGNTGVSQFLKDYNKEFVPVPLKVGSFVFHDQFTVHYSNQNSTSKPRYALTCIIKIPSNHR